MPSFNAIGSALSNAENRTSHMANNMAMRFAGPPQPLIPEYDLKALDNTAFLVNGRWTAEFVIAVFKREDGRNAEAVQTELAVTLGTRKEQILWERVRYFLSNPIHNVRLVLLQRGGNQPFYAGVTGHNGIMSAEIPFPQYDHLWFQAHRTLFDV